MREKTIRTAVIPVAGLGTRFLPATKAQPKEMLPIVDKPIIQYIVEEAVTAGIKNIIFVTSHSKRAIEDHFDRNFELEYRLEQQKKKKELKMVAKIGRLARFAFVRQAKPLGDGDALLAALPFLHHQEPVAVLFGDDLVEARTPTIGQLMKIYSDLDGAVMAVARVPRADISKYGVVSGKKISRQVTRVEQLVEKPSLQDAPSNQAIIGRYIITPAIIERLKQLKEKLKKDQELRLADALTDGLKNGLPLYAAEIQGVWHDCGSKLGFLLASIALGLKHPELKDGLRVYLGQLNKKYD